MKPQGSPILVLGTNGQVGFELARSLAPLGNVIALSRPRVDLANPETLRPLIRELSPSVIVNAAAHTAVDAAETEEDLAQRVNGVAPGVLAEEAHRCGALLVHYSTDYVFDGTKDSPYLEDDTPNPLCAYGRTKLNGERGVQQATDEHLILRISWVFAARGRNFLRTILRLAQEREEIKVVDDQTGAPTWARMVAATTSFLVAKWLWEKEGFPCGVYHLSAAGRTSWYGFASRIIETARTHPSLSDGFKVKRLLPIPSKEYPTPAKRPAYSVLNSALVMQRFGMAVPNWERGVDGAVSELVR